MPPKTYPKFKFGEVVQQENTDDTLVVLWVIPDDFAYDGFTIYVNEEDQEICHFTVGGVLCAILDSPDKPVGYIDGLRASSLNRKEA
jgi:hypothetical protein